MPETTAEDEKTAAELQQFRRSAMLFSGGMPLIEKFDGQWIAACGGEVRATADSYDGIFERMKELGIDARYALVRHIQQNQRTLII
jgi:hypothetical protein